MVYVGANDGMFHAFNLGISRVKPTGLTKSKYLTGNGQGEGDVGVSFRKTRSPI